jgi:hypothetical protein
VIDRVSVDMQGVVTVRGRLQNYPLGYVLISTTGDRSLATIQVPEMNKEYKIVYDPHSRSHYLLEIDPLTADKFEDSPAVIPPPPTPEEQKQIENIQKRLLNVWRDGESDPIHAGLKQVDGYLDGIGQDTGW